MNARSLASILALAASGLAVAGCGGGGGGGSGGAAGGMSGALTPAAAPVHGGAFEVLSMDPTQGPAASTSRLTLTFSRPVDASSVRVGTTLFALEDTDTNPGGSFAPLPGSVSVLDPAGVVLAFVPQRAFRDGREVRLVLTRGVRDHDGNPLERGAASAPVSFASAIPDAVFEGRFQPDASAPATPPASTPPPSSGSTPPPSSGSTPPPSSGSTPPPSTAPGPPSPPPSSAPTPPGIRPSVFQPESGTDVWHIDFDLRASTFLEDMRRHGLASGDPATDQLARDLIVGQALSWCSQKYRRTADGKAVSGRSWRVSFTATSPGGTPGRTHSREAVGGRHTQSSGILGSSLFDPGNRRREDNSRAGELGIFSRQIHGVRSTLNPPLTSRDRRYLDGSYRLGDGTSAEDARLQAILRAAADWGHALGSVIAHEVGHSVGLDHDDGDPLGIMRTATGSQLLSNTDSRMSATSAAVLDRNLGRAP